MKLTVLIVAAVLLFAPRPSLCQQDPDENGCPPISDSDLEGSDGIIAESFRVNMTGAPPILPTVELHASRLVCLSAAQYQGRYRGASVVARYTCTNADSLCSGTLTSQFDVSCIGGQWVLNVLDFISPADLRTTPADATLLTATRSDCSICISPELAELTDMLTGGIVDPVTHCVECHGDCNIGLMQCTGFNSLDCCNFYEDGICVVSCTSPRTVNATTNECKCPEPLTGENCTECVLECENGGFVTDINSCDMCTCPSGFQGTPCVNIDECNKNPCQNSGTCEDTFGSFRCICPTGFTGNRCQETNLAETCPAENTTLLSFGDAAYSWPKIVIGMTRYRPCPTADGPDPNANVSRECFNNGTGAEWSEVYYDQCGPWAADAFNNVTSQPETLEAETISTTVDIIDKVLTDEAIINSEVREQYLDIIDNLNHANDSAIEESEADTGISIRLLGSLGRFQDEVVLSPNATNGTETYARESFAVQVRDIDLDLFNGETFNVNLGSFEEALNRTTDIPEDALLTTMDTIANATASIAIPPTFISDLQVVGGIDGRSRVRSTDQTNQTVRLSYSVFLVDTLFPTVNASEKNFSVGTIIVGIRVQRAQFDITLTVPLNAAYRINQTVENVSSSMCVQWQDAAKFGEWSSDGCMEIGNAEQGEQKCECNKPAAHFAVLFDLNPSPPPAGVATALEIITYIGLGISIPSLLIMIATYLYSKKLRNLHHGQIILNLCVSLLGLYIVFLIAAHVTSIREFCAVISALLHYFILVFFGWTAAEAVYLYIKLVIVLGAARYERGYTWKAALVVWLVPVVIIGVSAGPGYKYYINEYFCRPDLWPFFFGLVLPFCLIYIFNWVMFFIINISLIKSTRQNLASHEQETRQEIWKNINIAMCLALVFGLGWGLGLAATSSGVVVATSILQIIFAVFVGFQGFLFLVFHGIRSVDARKVWMQWLAIISCRKLQKTHTTSEPSSSARTKSTKLAPAVQSSESKQDLTTAGPLDAVTTTHI